MDAGLFDRTTVVATLQANCLGVNGTSGVVVGSHKVGKTYLLNHLAAPAQQPADALVCRLDLDLLRVSLEPPREVDDDAFFGFLTARIADALGTWIAEESTHEDEWRRALAAHDATPSAQRTEALETAARALRSQLGTLEALRKVDADLERLLAHQPIKLMALSQVLEKIKRTKRRVLLIIDEFNKMLLEPKLTERVFGFLRGAASERKVITLGASDLHPMDAALHPHSDPERRALFNHYYAQQLAPFKNDEAAGFLVVLE
ncbi:MAG: hypothetical protein ACREMY_07445, partial [bacterium]